MNINLQQERLCQIAKAFMAHAAELETTLEVMQASFNQTIEQSSISRIEKNTLKRITHQVSPIGLKSLLEEIQLTVARTRLLYIEAYSEAAANLSATIYEQSGIAGPTGERSFNSKADGKAASTKEQSKHVIKPVDRRSPSIVDTVPLPLSKPNPNSIDSTTTPVVIKNNTSEADTLPLPATVHMSSTETPARHGASVRDEYACTPRCVSCQSYLCAGHTCVPVSGDTLNGIPRYKHYASAHPILNALTKGSKEPPSPVHQWVTECGYLMDSKINAQATIDKGLNALLWPTNDPNEVNAVKEVHVLPHPSGSGNVFMLIMNYPTTGNEAMHVQQCNLIDLTMSKVWSPKRYPLSIIVEVSPKASRECPFGRISEQRKGWEVINQYLTNKNQHETNSTNRKSRPSTTPKHKLETIY